MFNSSGSDVMKLFKDLICYVEYFRYDILLIVVVVGVVVVVNGEVGGGGRVKICFK